MTTEPLLHQARELSERLVSLQAPIRILDAVNWDRSVRETFFRYQGERNPEVDRDYYANRPLGFEPAELRQAFSDLQRDVVRQLGQLNPMTQYMSKMCREYRDVIRMLEARGTREFHNLSVELFGDSHDAFHAGEPTLAELADMLQQPLAGLLASDQMPEEPKDIPAAEAMRRLQAQVDASMPDVPVQIMLSDGILSDAAAGSDRIKLNQDVLFSQRELDILEVHEAWIHVGTTQNGLAQPWLTCLSKGTPSATITQEGLAVLTEIITLKSTPRRLAKLVNRVQATAMASEGATFIDIYRHYMAQGVSEDAAYTMAQRVFRGSTPEGLPFTKDLAYVKGFVLTYNLIRVAIQLGRIDRLPLLLVGKLSIDDFRLITELYDQGVIAPPKFVPPHFRDLRGLTTWLSFGRFIGQLSFDQLERDYGSLF
ncbi:flavohemoglobin expression-modulating QEGLA motif protein [Natronospirillum operosum]|uniref:Flavohemoglobin expression-modulating QEGLA motif protein n=1 Tax=Natronospirillum operosum TaxID=2759953 RepID=A0A4Z0WH52_9GAMM|nr:flavohemoglobin expression-modulating QEGLA motif protein [Natronospirillum operosum]TGG95096.1 flavohemoglobin expression-modulating QEGLA motif protein [Natronospirillum operosum]